MEPGRKAREQMLAMCGQIHEDDGGDARYLFRARVSRRPDGRKALQLCSQVFRTLSLVLSGELNDRVLRNLSVVSVQPAPDTSRLMVTVRLEPADPDIDAGQVLALLAQQSGRLRHEVAGAICRKRTPRLAFQVME